MAANYNSWASILASVLGLLGVGWCLWRLVKNSDEPVVLVIRWVITAVVLGFVFHRAAHARDGFAMIEAVLLAAVGGLIMIFVWREKFCGLVADQFASLYTGGSEPPDPTPFYSIAEAKRKRGKYLEAVAEVRAQLERFPTDFHGWMLLAEIQATDLKDVAAAHDTLEELLRQDGHAPKNVAYALNREADWHLEINRDREAARLSLDRIVELLPETEQAQFARQRLAHLTPETVIREQEEPRRLIVQHDERRVGLEGLSASDRPIEDNPAQTAARYVSHLDQFPHDNDAREKLAVIYARHYQRLDLAADQLEQMISFPNQPTKEIVRWLNLLADLQLELAGDLELARQTLERIVALFPKSAAAQNARTRIAHLKLELRPKQQSQVVKLGSYEQNIGLKGQPALAVPKETEPTSESPSEKVGLP